MSPRDEAEAADWLRLIRSQNVGPATFLSLLERFGTARAALDALPDLAERGGSRRPVEIASERQIERELKAAARLGIRHLFLGAPDYPTALAAVHAPPPVIMVRGNVGLLGRRPLAVVGSRKASAAGRTMAERLAAGFGAAGHAVASGLALGIDTAAHRASLDTGTIAVLAGGVDRPTPPENRDLADEIAASGALVSEMALGHQPYARDYPRRNRIIAGLSEAVVVVEAAARSGSLHTAHYAAEANREVFAVPGSPLDPRAAGSLQLLRDGAGLALSADDILVALAPFEPMAVPPAGFAEPPPATFEPPRAALDRLAESLSPTPMAVDELVRATGLSAADVLAAVVELELAGRAEREPNGAVRAALA